MNTEFIAKAIFYLLHAMEFIGYVPQVVKLIRTKSSRDISVASQLMLFFMTAMWLVYWVLTDLPKEQFVFCICIFIEVSIQLLLVIIYRKRGNPQEEA